MFIIRQLYETCRNDAIVVALPRQLSQASAFGSECPLQVGTRNFALNLLKAHEQPSIGVLLCASKEDKVVEYGLSRTPSPALIAEYQTMLPDKKLLQGKLNKLYNQNAHEEDE